MNCQEAEELLGAYALDALPDDEAAAMRAHLDGCAEHRAKVAELRAVAGELHALVDPLPPPPALRARILEAVGDTPKVERDVQRPRLRAVSSGASAVDDRPRSRLQWISQNQWGALAAALVLAVGGLLAWNIALQAGGDDPSAQQFAARATSSSIVRSPAGDAVGTFVVFGDEDRGVFLADGVPQPAEGKTYQMWALDEAGTPRSLGTMDPDGTGHAAFAVEFDDAATRVIAVTVEPAGGSPTPTTEPVLIAEV